MQKIQGIRKIISIGRDELSEHDLSTTYSAPFIGKIEADVFIYSYDDGGYGGSGVAVWRKGRKWSYQYLGHCSCNGPTEDIRTSDAAKFSLDDLRSILSSTENSWNNNYMKMSEYLKRYKF